MRGLIESFGNRFDINDIISGMVTRRVAKVYWLVCNVLGTWIRRIFHLFLFGCIFWLRTVGE